MTLVQVVGQVGGDIGGRAVTLDDDAVLIVAEFCGAQPGRAILLVDRTVLAQLGDGLVHPAAGVHRVFVGVDVEVGAELMQRCLDLAEHQVHADCAERLTLLRLRKAHRLGRLGEHLCGDVVDVGAGVAVLGCRLRLRGGDEGISESVDLGAVIVEVVLPHDLGSLGAEQPAEGVADGGPPGAADVNRTGRVGRDELEVNAAPGEQSRVAVLGTGDGDVGDDDALGRGLDTQVDESGPGDLGGGDAVGVGECGGQPTGEFAWVGAGLLTHLQRQVGRVVTMFGVARPLDSDRRRQRGGVEAVLGQHRGGGAAQQLGEVGGGHG